MRVVIAGASGLVGTALRASLERDGHTVNRMVRPGETGKPGYGLYDRALGAVYLNGLWEAVQKFA